MDVVADFQPNGSRGVIIHHWDTDGLCSAAELLNYCAKTWPDKTIDTFVPTVSNYYITDEQYSYLEKQQYDFVITCDINFQADTVNRLAELWPGEVYIFDHHHQTPYPNVHYYNEPYPACAAYICYALKQPYNLTAVMAIVGDREETIQHDLDFYPVVQDLMTRHGLIFTQLLQARQLIDSNYIVEDYANMAATISLLRDDPEAILTEVTLQSNLQQIGNVIDEVGEQQPNWLIPNVLASFELHTKMNLLSHMTRHWSRQYSEAVILTTQLLHDQYNCYIRRRTATLDMRNMISYARSLGLNSGGKEEVVGIIIPPGEYAEKFPLILAKLKSWL